MQQTVRNTAQEFDKYAADYDDHLNQALSPTGESKEYFATARVRWLMHFLTQLGEQPRCAIDYGCGVGDTSALLSKIPGLNCVTGLDASPKSLHLARLRYASAQHMFFSFEEYAPHGDIDLVYCNGTFHHIAVAERAYFIDYIRRCLRGGGLFSFWENNPWNPGTRYVMSRCAFDRDAVTLSPPEAKRLLLDAGFEIIHTSHCFFFPRFLKSLRFLEPWLLKVPLGGQYQILCRKCLG